MHRLCTVLLGVRESFWLVPAVALAVAVLLYAARVEMSFRQSL